MHNTLSTAVQVTVQCSGPNSCQTWRAGTPTRLILLDKYLALSYELPFAGQYRRAPMGKIHFFGLDNQDDILILFTSQPLVCHVRKVGNI